MNLAAGAVGSVRCVRAIATKRSRGAAFNVSCTLPKARRGPCASCATHICGWRGACAQDDGVGRKKCGSRAGCMSQLNEGTASPRVSKRATLARRGVLKNSASELLEISERLRQRGRSLQVAGDYKGALERFRRSVELCEQNGRAWQDLAKAEERVYGSAECGVCVLVRALRVIPNNAYLWQSLGILECKLGRHAIARRLFEAGLKKDINHTSIYGAWAAMESDLGDKQRARTLFEKAMQTGGAGARVYHTWGVMELKLGNVGRAQELFNAGLTRDPRNAYIWHSLGNMARDEGNYDRARKCYQKALQRNAYNVVVLDEWARLEADAGNTHVARTIFRRGVANGRDDARILHSWSLFEFQVITCVASVFATSRTARS